MKLQIRKSVFETNSSSVHTLTIVSKEEFDKWKNGDVLFDEWRSKFVEKTDENLEDEDDLFESYDQWLDNDIYECYKTHHTTKSGDEIVVFGKFGEDR